MSISRPTLLRIALGLLLLAATWWLRRPGLGTEIWNVDEAVTFTMAQQILAGEIPYRDATLVLRTEPRQAGRLNRAWSYWSGLKLELP